MAVTPESPGPYAPSSAILEVIDRYRNRGLQSPFTTDVLARAGVSDSLIPRTLQALQSLELIGADGMPTETFENIRRAKAPEFEATLASWLTSVYADVLAYVQPTDSEDDIRDAFRNYNPVGQQSRMVSLFTGLCRAAGLRHGDAGKDSKPRLARKPAPSTSVAKPRRDQQPPQAKKQYHADGALPPAIAGLLSNLPTESGAWTKGERDKFLKTFEAVLDYCFAIQERKQIEQMED